MRNAALIVEQGKITALLPIHELNGLSKQLRIYDFPTGIIVPAWVNAHCHLELSYLKNKSFPQKNFFDWVRQLLTYRSESVDLQTIHQSAWQQMQHMRSKGTALVADITNGPLLRPLPNEPLKRMVFFEILGFLPEKADSILKEAMGKKQRENVQAILTPHAPYSTSAPLMQKIAATEPLLSIHLAESKEEFDFFTRGSAILKNFLKERQAWPNNWQTPYLTPVQYLKKLNLLNSRTLIVHGVQVTKDDLPILKNSGAHVCLCARSNAYLNVGLPPVAQYLEHHIPLCIGTDSLASNSSLDLNEEISYLWERFNAILEPGELIKMATLNGARALNRQAQFGTLSMGKKATFNVFEFTRPIQKDPELAVITQKWSNLICF